MDESVLALQCLMTCSKTIAESMLNCSEFWQLVDTFCIKPPPLSPEAMGAVFGVLSKVCTDGAASKDKDTSRPKDNFLRLLQHVDQRMTELLQRPDFRQVHRTPPCPPLLFGPSDAVPPSLTFHYR